MSKFRLLSVGGALAMLTATAAQAALVGITNGNFETQVLTSPNYTSAITDWFESNLEPSDGQPTFYHDWLYKEAGHFTNGTNLLGLSEPVNAGYVYQQIGTYSANEIIEVSGIALKRLVNNFGGFTVSLLSGNFSGADGTPLSATLLDSASFTGAGLGLPTGSGAAQAPFSANLDSGNAGVGGTPLWLLITPSNSEGTETFLDNLQAVPEPGGLVLLGAAGVLGVRRRSGHA